MAAEDISRCAIEISHKSKHPEGSMAEKKIPSNYFDMTLDECRLVFDTIDNLIIIDNQGIIKYFSPGMFSMVEAYNKRALPDVVAGKHISEVHPASKIGNAVRGGRFDETCFYFASDVTNIAKIKNLYKDGTLVGAIDYDIFTDGQELKDFLDKIAAYSEKGFLNLQDTFQSMYETSKKQHAIKYCVTDIIGKSQAMISLRMQIGKISESNSTVLLTGKTGVGKEVVAHSIHNLSLRCKYPMVEINCAAIPESLVESELFGYEEGSFTGAKRGGRTGKFEMADKSTIFLDEIDQLPYHIQPKLLRVLQEREITRIGGETKPVDIRVIAATNKDLWNMVREGRFREDLYYRLNVVEVHIPPLTERKDDIPLLVNFQLKKLSREMTKEVRSVSKEVMELLMGYDWPGNVRELNYVLEQAMNICQGDTLKLEHFDSFVSRVLEKRVPVDFSAESPLERVRANAEAAAIRRALELTQNTRSMAARLLKISRTALYDKMQKYNISSK